jgi:hypothetical protein
VTGMVATPVPSRTISTSSHVTGIAVTNPVALVAASVHVNVETSSPRIASARRVRVGSPLGLRSRGGSPPPTSRLSPRQWSPRSIDPPQTRGRSISTGGLQDHCSSSRPSSLTRRIESPFATARRDRTHLVVETPVRKKRTESPVSRVISGYAWRDTSTLRPNASKEKFVEAPASSLAGSSSGSACTPVRVQSVAKPAVSGLAPRCHGSASIPQVQATPIKEMVAAKMMQAPGSGLGSGSYPQMTPAKEQAVVLGSYATVPRATYQSVSMTALPTAPAALGIEPGSGILHRPGSTNSWKPHQLSGMDSAGSTIAAATAAVMSSRASKAAAATPRPAPAVGMAAAQSRTPVYA